ncbi:MAG: glycoside hydrolase family 1 protein [Saprospiraceae bacterium]|nr:glycoside hydrolase family 1 protein [Saprospiraceae bacterium]
MLLQFPQDFFWGTSTAAAQIETASEHSFKGLRAKDGHFLERTTDHELRRAEDIQHIRRFGTVYRCSVDWARLQTEPYGKFHHEVVQEYRQFFQELTEGGMSIMFVLHHFTNPKWFEEKGGWLYEENLGFFTDFVKKCIFHFGKYVSYWNTFNEPNAYAANAYFFGDFPPHRKSMSKAQEVIKNMGIAHKTVYTMLKVHDKVKPVGISLNTASMKGVNILGSVVAKVVDYFYNTWAAKHFEKVDFWGLSYYANILFDPRLISEVHRPDKLNKMGIPHDQMWAYYPKGLEKIIKRFYKKYEKPIIITENGVCTESDEMRIQALKDYLEVIHETIKKGVPIWGYVHWSTFDNFEWHLGPTYRFGLMRVDLETKNRLDTEAARFYEKLTKDNAVDV